ncbi:MAG: (2Fe-2S)-binding protein [Pseudomonadota bacterium]
MIVCSCNYITKKEIAEVVRGFLEVDEWQLITVGMVYHALQSRGRCCGCFPNAIELIVEVSEAWHREREREDAAVLPYVARIREEHQRCETVRALAKMRSKSELAA